MNTFSFNTILSNELEHFLKRSIIGYGVYSMINQVWQPDMEDEIQLVRNIKIRAAALELESGKGKSYTESKLHELFMN